MEDKIVYEFIARKQDLNGNVSTILLPIDTKVFNLKMKIENIYNHAINFTI